MKATTLLAEKDLQIIGVRFQHAADRIRFESYPKRLTYKGREYILAEA